MPLRLEQADSNKLLLILQCKRVVPYSSLLRLSTKRLNLSSAS
jgi:hypothetical protein